MKFYRILNINEIVTEHQIQNMLPEEYKEIDKPDNELMIDEFWLPDTAIRNEKVELLFNKKFIEHNEENPDLSKFAYIKYQMTNCTSYIDMYRLIQELSRMIKQFQYEKWLEETYPSKKLQEEE